MKNNIEYKVVYSQDTEGLLEMVNEKIKEGFIPQGGIACYAYNNPGNGSAYGFGNQGRGLYQAMIKKTYLWSPATGINPEDLLR